MRIYNSMTSEQTPSDDEDHVKWLESFRTATVLNGHCGDIVFFTIFSASRTNDLKTVVLLMALQKYELYTS